MVVIELAGQISTSLSGSVLRQNVGDMITFGWVSTWICVLINTHAAQPSSECDCSERSFSFS